MTQDFMQRLLLTLMTLVATCAVTGKAIASETQDLQARLLADIGFQYAEIGQEQEAIEVLEQALRATNAMTDRCFQANPLAKVAGGYLLIGQERSGKQLLQTALQTAEAQAATGCSGSATSPTESLLNRAKEYAAAGHFDLAIALSSGLGDPLTLAEIAGQLSAAGQPRRAAQLVNQAIDLAQDIDDDYYRTTSLIDMAQQLRLAGQTDQVSLVLEQALESVAAFSTPTTEAAALRGTATLRIAQEWAAIDDEQQAIATLDRVLPQIQALSLQPLPLDKITQLVDAAAQYAALGQEQTAVAILDETYRIAQSLDSDGSRSREDALGRVAEGYATLGNFERALQIARSIPTVTEREAAFQRIAVAHAKTGEVEAAVTLARSIGNSNSVLIEIARHYLTNQQPEQAWMFVQAQQVEGILSEVAIGYLEAGQPEQALQLVQTGGLEGFMSEVALSYVEAGQPQQALKLAQAEQMQWLLPDIARGLAEQGQINTARQVAEAMTDKTYQVQAWLAIAQAYSQTNATAGFPQTLLNHLVDFFQGLWGESNREQAIETLNQALQVTQLL
jgi:tetratricopeptide (TPR) repeat protein